MPQLNIRLPERKISAVRSFRNRELSIPRIVFSNHQHLQCPITHSGATALRPREQLDSVAIVLTVAGINLAIVILC